MRGGGTDFARTGAGAGASWIGGAPTSTVGGGTATAMTAGGGTVAGAGGATSATAGWGSLYPPISPGKGGAGGPSTFGGGPVEDSL